MQPPVRLILAGFAAAAIPLLMGGAASAHHSYAAEFDATRPIELTGVVTRLDWMNPHTHFYLETRNDAGTVELWMWEMGSPNGLLRRGWTRGAMQPGDIVTVTGTRAKDGSRKANARSVVLPDGRRLFAASSEENGR